MLIILSAYFLGKLLLIYDIIGQIQFFEDKLEIRTLSNTRQLNYNEILKVEYFGNLSSDIIGPSSNFKTSIVKLYTSSTEYIIFETERNIIISEKDKNKFQTQPPMIENCLKAIHPKYGISENFKLRKK